jgi:hypothetical protein
MAAEALRPETRVPQFIAVASRSWSLGRAPAGRQHLSINQIAAGRRESVEAGRSDGREVIYNDRGNAASTRSLAPETAFPTNESGTPVTVLTKTDQCQIGQGAATGFDVSESLQPAIDVRHATTYFRVKRFNASRNPGGSGDAQYKEVFHVP